MKRKNNLNLLKKELKTQKSHNIVLILTPFARRYRSSRPLLALIGRFFFWWGLKFKVKRNYRSPPKRFVPLRSRHTIAIFCTLNNQAGIPYQSPAQNKRCVPRIRQQQIWGSSLSPLLSHIRPANERKHWNSSKNQYLSIVWKYVANISYL